MALDLYHVIPSIKLDESFDYFALEEFNSNQAFLQQHQHQVAEIEDFEDDFEILVFPDLATKTLVLNEHENYSDIPALIGGIANLQEQINQLAAGNSVAGKEPTILEITDNVLIKGASKEIFYHSITYETTPNTIKVLFYSEKGHQRKGMNSKFYNDFANNKLYFDKASVVKAYSYIDLTRGGNKELQQYFTENFIDNFIEGESIFLCSW